MHNTNGKPRYIKNVCARNENQRSFRPDGWKPFNHDLISRTSIHLILSCVERCLVNCIFVVLHAACSQVISPRQSRTRTWVCMYPVIDKFTFFAQKTRPRFCCAQSISIYIWHDVFRPCPGSAELVPATYISTRYKLTVYRGVLMKSLDELKYIRSYKIFWLIL